MTNGQIITAIIGGLALLVSLASLAFGGLGLLLTIAAIVWRGGQIVERQDGLRATIDEHRKESAERWKTHEEGIRDARHKAAEALHAVELLRAQGGRARTRR